MDALGIGFVVLLVVLSGIVAALGDALGRRLGKKRLRWGRLRPKHTAVMMTAIAGMLTTFLTILVLTLVSEPVREWIVRGQQVQRDLKDTTEELNEARGRLERAENDLSGVQGELDAEKKNLAAEQQKVAEATERADNLRKESEELRQQVAKFSEQLRSTADRLDALQSEYKELDVLKLQLEGNIKTYREQQDELNSVNNSLLALNDKYEEEIDSMESEIVRLKKEVEDTQQAQQLAAKLFEEESKKIEQDRKAALAELAEAEADLAAARTRLERMTELVQSTGNNNIRARTSQLIFHLEDELARLPVRTLLTETEAKTLLRRALEMASREAESRGASDAPNSQNSVSLMNNVDESGRVITVEMQSQAVIAQLTGQQEEQMIRVVALLNAFEKEWVPVVIQVLPNPVVYHAGDLIIEGRIDGSKGVQDVYEQLVALISNQVTERVKNDGLIPAVGQDQELGEISQEELQRVVTTIVEADRTVRVRFQAAIDMRASDQLKLEIVLLR